MYFKHLRGGIRLQAKRGGLLVTALLLCAIISLITLPSYLRLSQSALRQSQRAIYNVAAVSIAETGIEQAVWASNNNTSTTGVWSGWTNNQDGSYRRTFSGLDFGGGVTGVIKVVVSNPRGTNASVVCKAVISLQDGQSIEKWVFARLMRNPETMEGISLSDYLVVLPGRGTVFDSWISDPDNNLATQNLLYTAARSRSNAIISTTSTTLPSIRGDAAHYGETGNGSIKGTVRAASSASLNFNSDPPFTFTPGYVDPSPPQTVQMPSGALNITWGAQTNGFLGSNGTSSIYQLSQLTLNNGGQMKIMGNVTLLLTSTATALTIAGGSAIELMPNATLTIYTPGSIDMTGSGFVNNSVPMNLRIFGTSPNNGPSYNLSGSTSISAILYAPSARLYFNGGGSQFYGAATVKSMRFEGGAVHLDESLYNYSVFSDGPLAVKSYEELNSKAAQQTYGASMNF